MYFIYYSFYKKKKKSEALPIYYSSVYLKMVLGVIISSQNGKVSEWVSDGKALGYGLTSLRMTGILFCRICIQLHVWYTSPLIGLPQLYIM